MSKSKADIRCVSGNIMLFILPFSPELPVSKLAGWEQPRGLWKVRRGPRVALPNIVPTLLTGLRLVPDQASALLWLRMIQDQPGGVSL